MKFLKKCQEWLKNRIDAEVAAPAARIAARDLGAAPAPFSRRGLAAARAAARDLGTAPAPLYTSSAASTSARYDPCELDLRLHGIREVGRYSGVRKAEAIVQPDLRAP